MIVGAPGRHRRHDDRNAAREFQRFLPASRAATLSNSSLTCFS
jgi:hypothetical protein